MPERLFVYGTLRPGYAPAEIADAVATLEPLGPATIRGRLYDLGPYPGVILTETDAETIPGELFLVADRATFAPLDAYEDYRPDDPGSSLFLRVRATALLPNGDRLTSWVYVYNGPIPPGSTLERSEED